MITAITGTIGSGKSLVGNILRENGKTVFDCDKINAELLSDKKYLDGLKKLFPYAFPDDKFDKKLFSQRIFGDKAEREKLNDYAHPQIFNRLQVLLVGCEDEDCFVEIPLLKDEFLPLFDRVAVVDADESVRIRRIKKRDGVDTATAKAKVAAQKSRSYYGVPTVIIKNNLGKKELADTVFSTLL